jgi:hypothetical protein
MNEALISTNSIKSSKINQLRLTAPAGRRWNRPQISACLDIS